MLGGIIGKFKRRSGPNTVDDLTKALKDGLDLPSVYEPVIVTKSSGRKAQGNKQVELHDIDAKRYGSIAELRAEIERLYEDDDLSFRLTSPTDKDGVSDRMHFKTLREAGG